MTSFRQTLKIVISGAKGEMGDGVRLFLDFQHIFFNGTTKAYGPYQEKVESRVQRDVGPGNSRTIERDQEDWTKCIQVPLFSPAEV